MFQQFQFAFSNVDKHVKLLEQYVDHISLTFASLLLRIILLKKSRKELFSPKKYLFALKSISRQLPTNWALTIEAQLDLMPRFYQDAKVSVSVTTHRVLYENGIKLFIHIPIYEVKYQFQLYKVYSLPIYNLGSTHGVIYGQLADYLAISTDKETYIHLVERELERCKKTPSLWNCSFIRPVSRTSATPCCLVSLLWRKKRFMYSTYSIYIGNRKWLFYVQRDREVTYVCSPDTPNQKRITTNKITKMSVLEVEKRMYYILEDLDPTPRISERRSECYHFQ